MTVFTISKPEDGEKTAEENAEAARAIVAKKPALSLLHVFALVIISVFVAAIVAGIIVFFGIPSHCRTGTRGGDKETVPHGTDMEFERHGSFEDHQFSEHCHYDHDNDVVIVELEGDGFGENATLVYDFNRGFLTYVLPSQNKCFLGHVNQDDIDSFKNAHDGEILELGAVKPHNFTTTNETIPSVFLAQTTSPVVDDLCSSMDSHWIESDVDEGTSLSRQRRQSFYIRRVTVTTYYFSDGTVIRVTETVIVAVQ